MKNAYFAFLIFYFFEGFSKGSIIEVQTKKKKKTSYRRSLKSFRKSKRKIKGSKKSDKYIKTTERKKYK